MVTVVRLVTETVTVVLVACGDVAVTVVWAVVFREVLTTCNPEVVGNTCCPPVCAVVVMYSADDVVTVLTLSAVADDDAVTDDVVTLAVRAVVADIS